MRKIITILIALFGLNILSSNCLAAENEAIIKKIAQQMIHSKELSKTCIKNAGGNINKMIKVEALHLGDDNENNNLFQVEAESTEGCCTGAKRCDVWVYKRSDDKKSFSKIFGPEYPDQLIFMPGKHNGINDMIMEYPDGNFQPGITEYYIFNGKQYNLMKRTNRTSFRAR